MPQSPPQSASRYRALSALLAVQAAREAAPLRANPIKWLAALFKWQLITAQAAEQAVATMLADQPGQAPVPVAKLNPGAFTTPTADARSALDQIETDYEFNRLVEGMMQDAARAAQQVAITVTPDIQWVRHLTPPSCARCAVLAGRIYRYSEGFQRHPNCDCIMLPITVSSDPETVDFADALKRGDITGMSKADQQAIADGADPGRVVNVRRSAAGLTESGVVLKRAGRLTPAAIYGIAGDDRDLAVELLKQNGYVA